MARIIKLIHTQERRGLGSEDNPVRLVQQLWSLDGKLIAEFDDYTNEPKAVFIPDNIQDENN